MVKDRKFSDLIEDGLPILLVFYDQTLEDSLIATRSIPSLRATIGSRLKIISAEINDNREVVEALKIKVYPTYILYDGTNLLWRHSEPLDVNALITIVKEKLATIEET